MIYTFDSDLAEKFGVDEAIMLNNFIFWLKKNYANNDHFHDGNWWTYNSKKAFAKLFPFWSVDQIKRILNSLINQKILIVGNYNDSKYDQTNWYALSPEYLYFVDKAISPNGQGEMTHSSLGDFTHSLIKTDNKTTDNKTKKYNKKDFEKLSLEIIDYFNEKTGKSKYQSGSDRETIIKYVTAMLKSGDTVDDIKTLIDHKLANPNTKLSFELGAWINTKYAGDNLAKAKTWHDSGRPKIEFYDPVVPSSVVKPKTKLVKTHRYENPAYFTPENDVEKGKLAAYIMECYRDKIDPRNKKPLTENQWQLIVRHSKRAKFIKQQFVDYIKTNEVLTYTSLLDQTMDDKDIQAGNPMDSMLDKFNKSLCKSKRVAA